MEAVAELQKRGTSKNVPPTQWVSCKDFFAWIVLENRAPPSFATASMRRPCALRCHACAMTKSPRAVATVTTAMYPPTCRRGHGRVVASIATPPSPRRRHHGICCTNAPHVPCDVVPPRRRHQVAQLSPPRHAITARPAPQHASHQCIVSLLGARPHRGTPRTTAPDWLHHGIPCTNAACG